MVSAPHGDLLISGTRGGLQLGNKALMATRMLAKKLEVLELLD